MHAGRRQRPLGTRCVAWSRGRGRHATASRFCGPVSLGSNSALGRDSGRPDTGIPIPQRDGREASDRDPAQRRTIERHRSKDDGGVSRIGLGEPPAGGPDRRQGAWPRRRSHVPQTGGRAARGHARCLDVAGFRQHAAAAIGRDQRRPQSLGAAGRGCGRVGHSAVLRRFQPDRRHRQTRRHWNAPDGEPHRPCGDRRRPHDRWRSGPASDRAGHRRSGAHRSAIGLPQCGHHAAAVGNDRAVPGDRTSGGGGLLATDRLGRLEPIHHISECDHGRRGNGLRRLSHQPLSRLSAVGCGFRRGGQEGNDLHRESDHRIRHHGGNHFPPHQLRSNGSVQNGRSGVGDWDRRGIPGCADFAAGNFGACRAARLGQTTARTDRSALAAFRHPHCAPPSGTSGCQFARVGHPGQLCRPGAL